MNPQVVRMALVVLVALALPVTLVVLALLPRGKPPEAGNVTAGLQASVEAAAARALPGSGLAGGTREIELLVADRARARAALAEAAAALGGTSLSGAEDERLLIAVPSGNLTEFRRRAELITGSAMPGLESGDTVLGITLRPAGGR